MTFYFNLKENVIVLIPPEDIQHYFRNTYETTIIYRSYVALNV